jgi:sugar/nucleoside kinase (ribokinase family)
MKCMTIGGATQDTIIQYTPQEQLNLHTKYGEQAFLIIEEGKKIEVQRLDHFSGGGATNSAVSCTRLGADVTVICKIGTDTAGDFIVHDLEHEGLTTTHISRSQHTPTGSSIIVPCRSGDRCIFALRGANTELSYSDIPEDLVRACDFLYITSLSGQSSTLLLPLTAFARQNRIFVATNPGVSQLASGAHTLCQSLPNINILILNAEEANELMHSLVQTDQEFRDKIARSCLPQGSCQEPRLIQAPIYFQNLQFNIRDFFKEVLSRGPQIVVVTNGAEGVYAATGNTVYFHPSLPPQHLENTLGAGDAFGSCFATMVAQGEKLQDALRLGILNAQSVISSLGAKTGLLSQVALQQRASGIQKDLAQSFKL